MKNVDENNETLVGGVGGGRVGSRETTGENQVLGPMRRRRESIGTLSVGGCCTWLVICLSANYETLILHRRRRR